MQSATPLPNVVNQLSGQDIRIDIDVPCTNPQTAELVDAFPGADLAKGFNALACDGKLESKNIKLGDVVGSVNGKPATLPTDVPQNDLFYRVINTIKVPGKPQEKNEKKEKEEKAKKDKKDSKKGSKNKAPKKLKKVCKRVKTCTKHGKKKRCVLKKVCKYRG